jgi:hypothetical protein
MVCSSCGAAIRRDDGRFCSHCGAALADRPRISDVEWTTHPERFDEVAASPHFVAAMTAPAPRASMLSVLPLVLFLIGWCAIGAFIIGGFAEHGGIMVLGPIAIVGFGGIAVISMIWKQIRFVRAPVLRTIAVIVDKRTELRGGGESSSATTYYYATLHFKEGRRVELEATDGVIGMISSGDIGVALVRQHTLVAFLRVTP